jgi:hypothetical protein
MATMEKWTSLVLWAVSTEGADACEDKKVKFSGRYTNLRPT